MSLISAVLRAFDLMIQVAKLLGFTGIRYNKVEQRYEHRPGFTVGRVVRTLLYALHMLAVCYYVFQRGWTERENYMLNKIQPGFRPPLVILDCCEDALMAISHFVLCAHFKLCEDLIMASLNHTLLFVSNAKHVLKQIGSESTLPMAMPMLLLLLEVASLLGYCYKIFHERDPYYICILLLFGSALFYHLHPLFYCLQLLLQHCIYAGMNRFMQQRLTARHMRLLSAFLQLLPTLQRLHLPLAKYFAPYMGLLLLRICMNCCAFLAACKYDEKSLAHSFTLLISEDEQDEEEEAGNVPTHKLTNDQQFNLGRAGLLLWIVLRLAFLLLCPMSLLFGAHLLHKEQRCFKMKVITLIEQPELYEMDEQDSEPSTSTSEQAANRRSNFPKINILEIMVKSNLNAVDFNNEDFTILTTKCWELPLKSATDWILKLIQTMIAAIIVDLGQQLDIRHLYTLARRIRNLKAQKILQKH